ncbi:MAG: hypothetical protein IK066_09965, partial [Kiritimatiellae bacterium]|nr:hypothetical protein [Kiritimatiellia bacterium]
ALAGLEGGAGEVLQGGRHLTERVALEVGERVDAVLKTYGRQAAWRDWGARWTGSKASRSMAVAVRLAERGVGTPEPLAAVEVWRGKRLVRCQFLTRMVEGLSDFRAELTAALSRQPARCEEVIDLLQTVADAVRALHGAGVAHGDLGNQNIGLRRAPEEDAGWHKGWRAVFIDLNRARVAEKLSDAERGRDLARLDIPSDLRRVFFAMVHGGGDPPEAFTKAERTERASFDRHTVTRKWRHPVREARLRAAERENPPERAPEGRELWIWDGRSGQPVQAYTSRDRRKWLPASNVGLAVREMAAKGWAVEREARRLEASSVECRMSNVAGGGVGVSLESEGADDADWARQVEWLERLDAAGGRPTPVLVRIYRHAGEAGRAVAMARARKLAEGGRGVGLSLVQDRAAVREPGLWAAMLREVLERTFDFAGFYEVGHAPNRSKWGVWDYREARGLWAPLEEMSAKWPEARWLGPSLIDFEPYAALPLLGMMPKGVEFAAPSAALYVDRRGGPEGKQRGRDLVGKAAWLRAAARKSGVRWRDDRLVVTEVNWPLAGTGAWSPVCSPYDTKGPRKNDPSVGEEAAAEYLERYVRMALGSGHVSRVYWWRLAAHGFGLVDVPPEGVAWRARPAFAAMERVLAESRGK